MREADCADDVGGLHEQATVCVGGEWSAGGGKWSAGGDGCSGRRRQVQRVERGRLWVQQEGAGQQAEHGRRRMDKVDQG